MKSTMITALAFLTLFALGVQGQFGERKKSDRTITKVVKLLRSMLEKSKQEGEAEEKVWTKFKCFCDNNKAEKTKGSEDSLATIETVSSEIERHSGANGQAQMKIVLLTNQKKDATRAKDINDNNHNDAEGDEESELKELQDEQEQIEKAMGF
jgi:hypothetical protein